jgi:hypothetical protein
MERHVTPFRDWEILLVLGTTKADVSESAWPDIEKGQRVLEAALKATSDDEAKAVREYVTTLAKRGHSAKVRFACERVIEILDSRKTS